MDILQAASAAKKASLVCATLHSDVKNKALKRIIAGLENSKQVIFDANNRDLEKAKLENLAGPLLKRLKFDADKLKTVISGLESLILIPDPVGNTLSSTELDLGLELYKVTAPIGVVGIIFESRPDALVQIGSLALKSGNAVLLKGGSEAAQTNAILAEIIIRESTAAGFPEGWLLLLETRQDVNAMLSLDASIDLIIPRGSNEFVRYIMDHTRIPVMGHADGICHLYIDAAADIDMAVKLTVDSKTQYVAVCNALETLLVHKDIASAALPKLKTALEAKNVELRGCEKTREIIEALPATEQDWKTEYLDLILSIRIVDSLEEAVNHINTYGSHHTDAIVTNDKLSALWFLNAVDSANVFHNASTRFSDGYRYGLGAEVGISTNKLHARGPVGMEGLLSYKWKMLGSGQSVNEYTGEKGKSFSHTPSTKPFPQQ
ncbi:MAG: glutamate-5-semialdehyde dehydrogenase [Spirochaetales bacterium]|nr:glutamate-5-semialdehyde dehydrogenase [Spirochaetales bacterium]